MTRTVKAGTTDVSVVIRIVDSTDGTPETAVEHNTSGIALWYRREGAAQTAITEVALAALTTAHTDGGIEHIGDGYYRLDLPDAACASGVTGVMVGGTVTGMIVIGTYIELATLSGADISTLLGTPAGASISADVAAVKSDTAAILVDTGTTLDGKIDAIDNFIDTEIAALTTNLATANAALVTIDGIVDSILVDTGTTLDGKLNTIDDFLDTEIAALTTNLATVAGYLDTEIAAIKAKTDNLPADPAATTDVDGVPAALLDLADAVESGITVRELLKLIAAFTGGKLSGAGTTTNTIRNIGDTKDVVVATVDEDGNRSAITLDLT